MIKISNINFNQYFRGAAAQAAAPEKMPLNPLNSQKSVQLPQGERNYTIFDEKRIQYYVSQREKAIPHLKFVLQTSSDEGEIVEALYITDRLVDEHVKGIPAMYPVLSKFNNTKSDNIQSFLAGIYRKTQVPDGFGPLVKMLIQNSMKQTPTPANEEIGGAILEYIRNYSNNPKSIDY